MAFKPFASCCFVKLPGKVLQPSLVNDFIAQAEGVGFDIFKAMADVAEAIDSASNIGQQAYFCDDSSVKTGPTASAASFATGTLSVTRPVGRSDELEFTEGQVIEAFTLSSEGVEYIARRYVVAETTTLPAGDLGPLKLPIRAEFTGYGGNLDYPCFFRFLALPDLQVSGTVAALDTVQAAQVPADAQDAFSPLDVGRYVRLVSDPLAPLTSPNQTLLRRIVAVNDQSGSTAITIDPALDNPADINRPVTVEYETFQELGISLEQNGDVTGGTAGNLDILARDQGIYRSNGETDVSLCERLQRQPDIITPGAIRRITDRVLAQCNLEWSYAEPGDVDTLMGFTYGVHPYDFGQEGPLSKPTGSGYVGNGGVYLDDFGIFIIYVNYEPVLDFGIPYDNTAYINTRFNNAYDLPGPANPEGGGYYDGSPYGLDGCVAPLWQELDKARAAGIRFQIVLLR